MSLRTTVVFPEPVPPAMPMMNIFIGWLLDAQRAIGRRSAYWTLRYGSPLFNIGCKVTYFFVRMQIQIDKSIIFEKKPILLAYLPFF
jgi:hypothetical protein